jgi:hypothetical protein
VRLFRWLFPGRARRADQRTAAGIRDRLARTRDREAETDRLVGRYRKDDR